MKFRSIALLATLAAVAVWPSLVSAEAASQQRQTTTPAFQETIPNIPGKSLVGLVVTYPPGGATQAHYHPRSAFVTGYALSGSIRSQVNDGKTQVFRAGESWTEPPDAYHPISENVSATVITPGWSTNRVASRSADLTEPVVAVALPIPEPETDGRSTHQPPITEALVPAHRPPKVAKAFNLQVRAEPLQRQQQVACIPRYDSSGAQTHAC
jgi:quercetin dioxygenase-like cupin family protein